MLRKKKQPVNWCSMIWFRNNIPRHAFIAWLAIRRELKTLSKLREWGVVQSNLCVLCWSSSETENHLFHGCRYAKTVWRKIKIKSWIHEEYAANIKALMPMNYECCEGRTCTVDKGEDNGSGNAVLAVERTEQ